MNDTKRSRNAHVRACLGCQKRKTRCVPSPRDPSICAYCMRTGAQCVFEDPPVRTPLTRKNLNDLERRCVKLESLLRTLVPGIDIEAELKRLGTSRLSDPKGKSFDDGYQTEGSLDEDYEWNEVLSPRDPRTAEFKGDGFGSTSTTASGYLGSSSASRILQRISALLSPDSPPESQDGRPTPGSIRVRCSHTPSPTVNSALASIVDMSRLIDAYFLCYNSNYPLLHERTFRERWEKRARISQASSWVPICYVVLSIGQWILGDSRDECPYYAKARSWVSAECLESGTLGLVQAFLLMGNYVQKRDRPNTGYNMMGIAHRMALGLGIHREVCNQGDQDPLALERRRQLFWTLFCFDSGLSITTGRPATIIDAFVDARMPRNIDDSDLDVASRTPPVVDYPTTYSAIIAHSHLAIVANEIYTKFLSARFDQPESNYETVVELGDKLQKWEDSLPGYFTEDPAPEWFRGNRAMVCWRAKNLRILLWRGSQRNHKDQSDKLAAGLRCASEAKEGIKDIAEFCTANVGLLNILLSWYATYFLFQAMLVLEVQRLEERATPYIGDSASLVGGMTSDEALELGRRCLNMLNTPKSAAGRCLETLDRIHRHMPTHHQQPAAVAVPGEEQIQLNDFGNLNFGYQGFGTYSMNAADMQWAMPADPYDLFSGVEGFPGTLDQQAFDCFSADLYRV